MNSQAVAVQQEQPKNQTVVVMHGKQRVDEFVFRGIPLIYLTWPMMVMGFVLWFFAEKYPEGTGRMWLLTSLIVMFIGFSNVSFGSWFTITVTIGFVGVGAAYFFDIHLVKSLIDFLQPMTFQISANSMVAYSVTLLILYIILAPFVWSQRYVVTPGKIVRRWGLFGFNFKAQEFPLNPNYPATMDAAKDTLKFVFSFGGGWVNFKDQKGESMRVFVLNINQIDRILDNYEVVPSQQ